MDSFDVKGTPKGRFYLFVLPPLMLSIIAGIALYLFKVDAALQTDVNPAFNWSFLERKEHYAILLGISIFFPFILSFDKNVHFWKKWGALAMAAIFVGAFYIIWDSIFTKLGVWGFNANYHTGAKWLSLPWEEISFFIIIPYCCIFIYECLNFYLKDVRLKIEPWLTGALFVFLLLTGIIYADHLYTGITFLFGAAMTAFHAVLFDSVQRVRFYRTWLICLIPFFLINGSLTGGFTLEPVVLYSSTEFIGIRIYTVPLDDAIYLYGYLLWVITLFDFFKNK